MHIHIYIYIYTNIYILHMYIHHFISPPSGRAAAASWVLWAWCFRHGARHLFGAVLKWGYPQMVCLCGKAPFFYAWWLGVPLWLRKPPFYENYFMAIYSEYGDGKNKWLVWLPCVSEHWVLSNFLAAEVEFPDHLLLQSTNKTGLTNLRFLSTKW